MKKAKAARNAYCNSRCNLVELSDKVTGHGYLLCLRGLRPFGLAILECLDQHLSATGAHSIFGGRP